MLKRDEILALLAELDAELAKNDVVGEIGLCGGAVMCLVFKARASTKDVDAIFAPTGEIRKAAAKIAKRRGLAVDWLNDAAKTYFVSDPPRIAVWEGKSLRVWAPTAEYMLAMKAVAARFDGKDRQDVVFLLGHLGLNTVKDAFDVIERYYPRRQIPTKTQFLIEEILETQNLRKK